MTEKLDEALAKLADKLGTSVEKIYLVLTKQTRIDAVINVIYLFMIIIAAYFLYHGWEYIIPFCKPENPAGQYSFDREWPGNIQLAVCGLGLGTVIVVISTFIWVSECLPQILTAIFNPEAPAIDKILDSIHSN